MLCPDPRDENVCAIEEFEDRLRSGLMSPRDQILYQQAITEYQCALALENPENPVRFITIFLEQYERKGKLTC